MPINLNKMHKKIAVGSDHAGFEFKEILKAELEKKGFEVQDFGTNSNGSVDYPDFAHPVASSVENGETEFGVLVCGSGNGVAMTANKHRGVRAALCWSIELASLARQHNNANILCIPARFVNSDLAVSMLSAFLEDSFEGGRHNSRVTKISC